MENQRVKKIAAFPLAYEEPHYRGMVRSVTLVRIEAYDGTVGWGEAISQFPEASRATKVLIDDGFAPQIEGEPIEDVRRLWRRMCEHAYWYGVEGIAAFAISAIDLALWDLKGKIAQAPVARLLGSPVRTEIPAMGSIIFDMEDLDWTLAEFAEMKETGYRIVKAGWGMTSEAVFGDDRRRDFKYLAEIREVIGPELGLVVDIPGARGIWDVDTAIQRTNEWEGFDVRWIEQPLPPGDLAGYAQLRQASPIPIGAGEDEWSPETYRHVIDAGAVDVLQMDPGRCLGLTGCQLVIDMCEHAHITYSAHSWSGAINTAASLHFLAISSCGDTLDFKPHASPMQNDLVEDPWVPDDGILVLRDTPGLGVSVRDDALAEFRLP